MRTPASTYALYADLDAFESYGVVLSPENDYDPREVARYEPAPRYVAPEEDVVEAVEVDLVAEAKDIVAHSLTSREAGFKLVALAKKHGFDSQQAFRYARDAVKALFWKRPGIKPIKFNDGHYSNGLYKIPASNWSAQQRRSRGDARRFLNRNKASAGA